LTNGLGGTELQRTGGFPGTVVGREFVAFGDVLRQIFASDYPTWGVGFTVSYPLGRSADQSALARTKLERDQDVARLRSSELKAVREVRQAGMQLEQNRQRIETTRLGRELSEQRLDQEQKRFEVGMSTNFNVIQAQRDLAVARNNELLAQLDYQQALIAFETAQLVGGSTTTTTTFSSQETGTLQQGTRTTTAPATTTGTSGGSGGPGGV
jgi:outer membrane protein TolC